MTAPGSNLTWATGPLLRHEVELDPYAPQDLDRVLAGLQNLPSEEDDRWPAP